MSTEVGECGVGGPAAAAAVQQFYTGLAFSPWFLHCVEHFQRSALSLTSILRHDAASSLSITLAAGDAHLYKDVVGRVDWYRNSNKYTALSGTGFETTRTFRGPVLK